MKTIGNLFVIFLFILVLISSTGFMLFGVKHAIKDEVQSCEGSKYEH